VPPGPQVISEKELRQLLLLVDQAPDIFDFDPAALVRVVNGLLPLGKKKVLAAIEEYERVAMSVSPLLEEDEWIQSSRKERPNHRRKLGDNHLMAVMAVLFEGNGSPRVGLGKVLSPTPATDTPTLPLVVVDDVPLIILGGLALAGHPSSASGIVPFYRKYGRFRQNPLRPSGYVDAVLAHAEAVPLARQVPERDRGQLRPLLQMQLMEMLTPLYPASRYSRQVPPSPQKWNGVMADLQQRPIRWNISVGRYERL
jgi:hypothetical protein